MIHYTLLPEKEIRALKKEYRTRLAIFLLFFMSCAILIGIGSLIPAYVFSYSQEKEALDKLSLMQKSREESGANEVIKDLAKSNEILKKLNKYKNPLISSLIISQVIKHKTNGLHINSFDISNSQSTSTPKASILVQGKSNTREALILFKDRLEGDPLISKVELPVSDLAKSKDIPFSIKVDIMRIQ